MSVLKAIACGCCPSGAGCCFPDAACQDLPADDCFAAGGFPIANPCADVVCPAGDCPDDHCFPCELPFVEWDVLVKRNFDGALFQYSGSGQTVWDGIGCSCHFFFAGLPAEGLIDLRRSLWTNNLCFHCQPSEPPGLQWTSQIGLQVPSGGGPIAVNIGMYGGPCNESIGGCANPGIWPLCRDDPSGFIHTVSAVLTVSYL